MESDLKACERSHVREEMHSRARYGSLAASVPVYRCPISLANVLIPQQRCREFGMQHTERWWKITGGTLYVSMYGSVSITDVSMPRLNKLSLRRIRPALSLFLVYLVVGPGSCQFIFNPTIPGNAIVGVPGASVPSPNFLDQQALAISGELAVLSHLVYFLSLSPSYTLFWFMHACYMHALAICTVLHVTQFPYRSCLAIGSPLYEHTNSQGPGVHS